MGIFGRVSSGFESGMRFFDLYRRQPVLTAGSRTTYMSGSGLVAALGYLAVLVILIYSVCYRYTSNYYIDQTNFATMSYSPNLQQYLVTGKDIFFAIQVKDKFTRASTNMNSYIGTLMNAFIALGGDKQRAQYSLEPCSSDYMASFQNGVSIENCWKPPDGLQISLQDVGTAWNMTSLYFPFQCFKTVTCSGAAYDALANTYNSFWATHGWTIYFTSSTLDDKNKKTFLVNQISEDRYFKFNNTIMQLQIPLTPEYFFIDDSILPTRNNRTVTGINYYQAPWTGFASSGTAYYNSWSIIFYLSTEIQYTFRYYTKIDYLVACLGGILFCTWIVGRCIISRLNRYGYRQSQVRRTMLYDEGNNNFSLVKLNPVQQLVFPFYNHPSFNFIFKSLKKPGSSLYNYSKAFRHLVYRQSSFRHHVAARQILHRQWAESHNAGNFKSKIPMRTQLPPAPLQEGYVNDEDQKLAELEEWDEQQLYQYKNLPAQTKQQYLFDVAHNSTYDRKQSEVARVDPEEQGVWYFDYLMDSLEYIDMFKVKPDFYTSHRSTVFSGFLSIVMIVLFILTISLRANFWSARNPIINVDMLNVPVENVRIPVNTSDTTLGVCFYDSGLGVITNVGNYLMFSKLQLFVYSKQQGLESSASYPLQLVGNDTDFTNKTAYISDQLFGNCYVPPKNVTFQMSGSQKTPVSKYFSIRISPNCPSNDSTFCTANKAAIATNTFNLLNNFYMNLVFGRRFFDYQTNKIVETVNTPFVLYTSRNKYSNITMTEAVYVDNLLVVDDTSGLRSNYRVVGQGITSAGQAYETIPYTLPSNAVASPATYECFFLVSGNIRKYVVSSPKFDFTLGFIGACAAFFYFLIGFFAVGYNSLSQRLLIGKDLFSRRGQQNEVSVNFCWRLMYMLVYPFRQIITPGSCLDGIHSLNQKMIAVLNLENMIKRVDTLLRLYRGDDFKKLGKYKQVYIKEILDPNFSIVAGRGGRVDNIDRMINNPGDTSSIGGQSMIIDQISQAEIPMDELSEKDPQIKRNRLGNSNNSLPPITGHALRQQEHFEKRSIKQSIPNCLKRMVWYLGNKLGYVFGLEGELTIKRSEKFGTVCGGIVSLIFICLIIWLLSYFGGMYLRGENYTTTLHTNPIRNQEAFVKLTVDRDFRCAVGFVGVTSTTLVNVSSILGASDPFMQVVTVQATFDKTNKIYQEKVYPMVPCPADYLNSGKFVWRNTPFSPDMTLAYCIPTGTQLQVSGDDLAPVKKWFYVSAGSNMRCSKAPNCSSLKTNMSNFLVNTSVATWFTAPEHGSLDPLYSFKYSNLLTAGPNTYSGYMNATFSVYEYSEDGSLFSNSPKKFTSYDYSSILLKEDHNYVNDNAKLYRNVTFGIPLFKDVGARYYTRADQFLMVLGGILFIVFSLVGACVGVFNRQELKLALTNELHVFVEDNKYKKFKASVFKRLYYAYFGWLFKSVPCLASILAPSYNEFRNAIESTHTKTDITEHLRTINNSDYHLRQRFMQDDRLRGLIDLFFKRKITQTSTEGIKAIVKPQDRQQFVEKADLLDLAPHERQLVKEALAIDRNMLGPDAAKIFADVEVKEVNKGLQERPSSSNRDDRLNFQNSEMVMEDLGGASSVQEGSEAQEGNSQTRERKKRRNR